MEHSNEVIKSKELIGKKYGRLTIIEQTETILKNNRKYPQVRCICDCGKIYISDLYLLRCGAIKSCGCYRREFQHKDINGNFIGKTTIDNLYDKNIPCYKISKNYLQFRNEFDWLKLEGFFMIKVVRENLTSINHISETGQDEIKDEEYNYVLNNNSSIDDLRLIIRKEIITKLS